MEKQLAVVVLNYENYKDTIECVRSLLNQDYKSLNIIIVENGSKNESLKILKEHFSLTNMITIIESHENLGFARGNNLGILFAKNKLNCQYVFVLNNDTILTTNKILSQMMIDYPSNIALVSLTLVGHQDEIQYGHNWYKDKMIKNTIRAFLYTCFDIIPTKLRRILIFIKRTILSIKNENYDFIYQYDNNQYQIQGAAFLLTPAFFKYYKIPYPRTFLYCEEINMSWYLYKVKLTTMVIKTDAILHKEAQSTLAAVLNNNRVQNKAKLSIRSFTRSIPMYFSSYNRIIKKYSE